MARGGELQSTDHTPKWSQGDVNILQQPWYVPSQNEFIRLYLDRQPSLLGDTHGSPYLTTGAGSSRKSPYAFANSMAFALGTEALPDGTWIQYAGINGNWAPESSGIWPLYTPPNNVVTQNDDGTWRRDKRTPRDGPPTYCWEQYREYIRRWGLPMDAVWHAHRNGRTGEHRTGFDVLGYISYPKPEREGPYSLHPSLFNRLEQELRRVNSRTHVVRVHPFPYRVTVESKNNWNSTYKEAEQTEMQDIPWPSLRAVEPPSAPPAPPAPPTPSAPVSARAQRLAGRAQRSTQTTVERGNSNQVPARRRREAVVASANRTESPSNAAVDEPEDQPTDARINIETAPPSRRENAAAKTPDPTSDSNSSSASEDEGDQEQGVENIETARRSRRSRARSPLRKDHYTANDGTPYPKLSELQDDSMNEYLRKKCDRWRQQTNRRKGGRSKEPAAPYSTFEVNYLKQWLAHFNITFSPDDLVTEFNDHFHDRPRRSKAGLIEKIKRLTEKDTGSRRGAIQAPASLDMAYQTKSSDWQMVVRPVGPVNTTIGGTMTSTFGGTTTSTLGGVKRKSSPSTSVRPSTKRAKTSASTAPSSEPPSGLRIVLK